MITSYDAYQYWYKYISLPDPVSQTAKNKIVSDILSVLDLVLVTSLAMMVFIGGYENVIGRVGSSHDYPKWIGKLEIGELKIKVAASIIIISSLHFLLAFMQIDTSKGMTIEQKDALIWTSIVHVVFVASALMLSVIEWIGNMSKKHK